MKSSVLFSIVLTMCLVGLATADQTVPASQQPAVDNREKTDTEPETTASEATKGNAPHRPIKGNIIWLEKKIAPSTRWIENLVKPLNIWMERKIQAPDTYSQEQPQKSWGNPDTTPATATDMPDSVQKPVITQKQAASAATRKVPGEVLRIKLLSKHAIPRYRVKLLSTTGEIHILYVNAHTSALMQPIPKPANR